MPIVLFTLKLLQTQREFLGQLFNNPKIRQIIYFHIFSNRLNYEPSCQIFGAPLR